MIPEWFTLGLADDELLSYHGVVPVHPDRPLSAPLVLALEAMRELQWKALYPGSTRPGERTICEIARFDLAEQWASILRAIHPSSEARRGFTVLIGVCVGDRMAVSEMIAWADAAVSALKADPSAHTPPAEPAAKFSPGLVEAECQTVSLALATALEELARVASPPTLYLEGGISPRSVLFVADRLDALTQGRANVNFGTHERLAEQGKYADQWAPDELRVFALEAGDAPRIQVRGRDRSRRFVTRDPQTWPSTTPSVFSRGAVDEQLIELATRLEELLEPTAMPGTGIPPSPTTESFGYSGSEAQGVARSDIDRENPFVFGDPSDVDLGEPRPTPVDPALQARLRDEAIRPTFESVPRSVAHEVISDPTSTEASTFRQQSSLDEVNNPGRLDQSEAASGLGDSADYSSIAVQALMVVFVLLVLYFLVLLFVASQ